MLKCKHIVTHWCCETNTSFGILDEDEPLSQQEIMQNQDQHFVEDLGFTRIQSALARHATCS